MASKGKISEIVDIEAVKAQLKVLNDGVSLAATNIEKVTGEAIKLNASFKDAKGIKELTDNYVKLNKVQNDNAIAQEKLKQQTIATEKAQITLENTVKKQNQTLQNQQSEYQKLSKQLTEARNSAKDLAAQYGINDIRARQAAEGVQFLDKKVKDIDASVGQHNRNVGNYGDSLKGVGTKILGFASAIGIGIGAVEMFKGIINSTNSTGDKFAETMAGSKEATNAFFRAVASGDWSNLIGKMTQAYEAGVEYEKQLDRLRDRAVSQNAQLANIDNLIAKQKLIIKTDENSLAVKKSAEKELERLETLRLTTVEEEAKLSLDAATNHASKLTGLNKEQIKDLVSNYKQYESAIDEAGKKAEELKRKATSQQTTRQGFVFNSFDLDLYNKLLAQQTPALQKNIKAYEATNIIFAEEGKIAKDVSDKIVTLKNANTEYTMSMIKDKRIEEKIKKEEQKDNAELQASNKKLLNEKLDNEDGATIERLNDIEILINNFERKAKKEKSLDDEVTDLILQNSQEQTDAQLLSIDTVTEAEKKAAEKRQQIREASFNGARDVLGAIGQLTQISYDKDLALIDEKSKADEAAKQKELDAAGNNQALKDKINAKYEAKEKLQEKERKKIEAEKAKANKETSIFNIILDTARAIVGHLMQPWMIPFDVLTGGLQLAVAQAVPIPKYKHGRKGGYGEFAVVGDGGTEGIQLATGERYLTPNKDTLTYLPKGASVIPNYELFKNSAFENIQEYTNTFNMDLYNLTSEVKALQSGFIMVADTVKNKSEWHLNITKQGIEFLQKNGSSIAEYTNNRLHN